MNKNINTGFQFFTHKISQNQLKSPGKIHYQISKFVQFYCSFLRGKGWSIQVADFTVSDENWLPK